MPRPITDFFGPPRNLFESELSTLDEIKRVLRDPANAKLSNLVNTKVTITNNGGIPVIQRKTGASDADIATIHSGLKSAGISLAIDSDGDTRAGVTPANTFDKIGGVESVLKVLSQLRIDGDPATLDSRLFKSKDLGLIDFKGLIARLKLPGDKYQLVMGEDGDGIPRLRFLPIGSPGGAVAVPILGFEVGEIAPDGTKQYVYVAPSAPATIPSPGRTISVSAQSIVDADDLYIVHMDTISGIGKATIPKYTRGEAVVLGRSKKETTKEVYIRAALIDGKNDFVVYGSDLLDAGVLVPDDRSAVYSSKSLAKLVAYDEPTHENIERTQDASGVVGLAESNKPVIESMLTGVSSGFNSEHYGNTLDAIVNVDTIKSLLNGFYNEVGDADGKTLLGALRTHIADNIVDFAEWKHTELSRDIIDARVDIDTRSNLARRISENLKIETSKRLLDAIEEIIDALLSTGNMTEYRLKVLANTFADTVRRRSTGDKQSDSDKAYNTFLIEFHNNASDYANEVATIIKNGFDPHKSLDETRAESMDAVGKWSWDPVKNDILAAYISKHILTYERRDDGKMTDTLTIRPEVSKLIDTGASAEIMRAIKGYDKRSKAERERADGATAPDREPITARKFLKTSSGWMLASTDPEKVAIADGTSARSKTGGDELGGGMVMYLYRKIGGQLQIRSVRDNAGEEIILHVTPEAYKSEQESLKSGDVGDVGTQDEINKFTVMADVNRTAFNTYFDNRPATGGGNKSVYGPVTLEQLKEVIVDTNDGDVSAANTTPTVIASTSGIGVLDSGTAGNRIMRINFKAPEFARLGDELTKYVVTPLYGEEITKVTNPTLASQYLSLYRGYDQDSNAELAKAVSEASAEGKSMLVGFTGSKIEPAKIEEMLKVFNRGRDQHDNGRYAMATLMKFISEGCDPEDANDVKNATRLIRSSIEFGGLREVVMDTLSGVVIPPQNNHPTAGEFGDIGYVDLFINRLGYQSMKDGGRAVRLINTEDPVWFNKAILAAWDKSGVVLSRSTHGITKIGSSGIRRIVTAAIIDRGNLGEHFLQDRPRPNIDSAAKYAAGANLISWHRMTFNDLATIGSMLLGERINDVELFRASIRLGLDNVTVSMEDVSTIMVKSDGILGYDYEAKATMIGGITRSIQVNKRLTSADSITSAVPTLIGVYRDYINGGATGDIDSMIKEGFGDTGTESSGSKGNTNV